MTTGLTDEDIDAMRESMATAPIGAVADAVWGVADDPREHGRPSREGRPLPSGHASTE
jgi:hypothetical protein